MSLSKLSTMSLSVLFIVACSGDKTPETTPPAKTVFDPLTQQMDRARKVQKTVDQHADSTKQAVDTQERGDTPP
jgi:hypothetical protein